MATITYIRQLEEKRGLFFQIGLTIALLITWIALQLTFTYTLNDLRPAETETEPIIFEVPIIKNKEAAPPVPVKTTVNKQPVATTLVSTSEPLVSDPPVEIIPNDLTEPVPAHTSTAAAPVFIPPVLPEFEGGMDALYRFLQSNLKYDRKAVREGISGTVYLSFKVAESGHISDIKVLKGVHPLLDAEAIRVVSLMPRWNPGRNYDGSPVSCTFNLPVSFKLK
jgi:protein TonB